MPANPFVAFVAFVPLVPYSEILDSRVPLCTFFLSLLLVKR